MANDGRLDDLVSEKAFKQVEDINSLLLQTIKTLNQTTAAALEANKALGGSQSVGNFNKNAQAAALAQEKVNTQLARTEQINQRIEQSAVKFEQQQNQRAANETKRAQQADSNYARLIARQKELNAAAREAGATFGASSEQYKQAQTAANLVNKEVKVLNEGLGNYSNNVGNYLSKGYGLIRQLANILPGLGISGIFLAIYEYGNKAFEALTKLTDKAKEYVSIVKILNDVNLKGTQEAQAQLVSLDALYRATQNTTLSLTERKKAVDQLQQQYPDFFKNVKDETILAGKAKDSYNALRDAIIATARARASQDAIVENTKRQLKDEDIIREQEAKNLKNKQDQRTAQAEINELNRTGLGNRNTQNDALNTSVKTTRALADATGRIAATNKIINDATKDREILEQRNLALIKNIDAQVKKSGVRTITGGEDNNKPTTKPKETDTRGQALNQLLQQAKSVEEKILQDENSSFAERYKAVDTYEKRTNDLIKSAQQSKIITSIDAGARLTEIDKNVAKQRQDIQTAINKYVDEQNKLELARLNDSERAKVQATQTAANLRLAEIERERDARNTQLIKDLEEGKISINRYNAEILESDQQAATARLDVQIEATRRIIETQAAALAFGIGSAEELARSTEQLNKLIADADTLKTKKILDNAKQVEQAREQLKKKEIEIAGALIDLGQQVAENIFAGQQKRIAKQSEEIDKTAAKEKKANASSLRSSKDKARIEAEIDEQSANQKAALDQQAKEAARKQAVADKAFAVARIIFQTAIAASAALTPPPVGLGPIFGIPLAVATGVLGAVQLATVLAQPLPAYEHGTDYAKGGLSRVSERGTELVVEPSGKSYLTPEVESIINIPRGSKVFTNDEVKAMIPRPQQITFSDGRPFDLSELSMRMDEQTRVLKKIEQKRNMIPQQNRAAEAYRRRYFNLN